jgi:hypothetical protein
MDTQEAPLEVPTMSIPFVFSSPKGYALCRHILETHFDVQMEGICKLCDRVNVSAILHTGMGKTSFLQCTWLLSSQSLPNHPFVLQLPKTF